MLRLTACTLSVALACIFASSAIADEPAGHKVKLTLKVNGDVNVDSHVTITWGHRDYDENKYVVWRVGSGAINTKEIYVPDAQSEFEIQTEGGKYTGYDLLIEIDNHPAIICKFKADPGGVTQFQNLGVVHTERSSNVNGTGEGNLRVFFDQPANPGPIPMRKH
jgi:hypothetical protein